MRQIVLDTETTGLETEHGHRIIEIGAVELVDRRLTGRNFHQYINPERDIDLGALEVHGLSREFLSDKPRFAEIAEAFTEYADGAELVIHNAPFDLGFLDYEYGLMQAGAARWSDAYSVIDTLILARDLHPGQRNSLDALCKRYEVDNSQRELHGALLDAEILADVYLAMTGGQTSLALAAESVGEDALTPGKRPLRIERRGPLPVVRATEAEERAHNERLEAIRAASGECVSIVLFKSQEIPRRASWTRFL